MRRTRLERSIIAELEAKIKEIENYKKKLLAYIHHIKDKCLNREITFSDYESLLNEKQNGKKLHEWLEHYEEYIDKCKKRIKKLENKAKRKRISVILGFIVILAVLIFSVFYFRPVIVGLVIQEQLQNVAQQLNLEFNDSLEYEWAPEYSGRLQAFKISGLIQGEGSVKVYLDNILVLDSSDLNNSEGIEIGTSKLTGLAISENATEEPIETIENKSALPEENISLPEENITTPENITKENVTEENITAPEQEITIIEFKDYCKDTCSLDLNKTNYTLKIEISDAKLKLHEIKYELLTSEAITPRTISEVNATLPEANITNETTRQYKAVIGKPVRWIKTIELEQPGTVKIKLPKEAENISVNKITEETRSYSVEEEALASPSQEKQEPLLSSENLTTEPTKITENKTTAEENRTAEENITKEVIAEQNITELSEINETPQEAKFSMTAKAITEEKSTGIFSYLLTFFRNFLSIMTGRVITTEQPEEIELIIEDNATEYEIEYYTEAPQAFEQETAKGKTITISAPSELNYTDVLAYTELPFEVSSEVVKLYHITETGREEANITEYDLNENNLTDYIEWNVEHLSNQTYELEIIIINVKSLPQVGKNWTVMFNTTGKANLTITAFNGTNWSNSNEDYDLKFLEVKCGEQVLNYEWVAGEGNASVFISDYECNETGFEISKVLTTGVHTLEFDFGGTKAYAYNTAGILNLEIFGFTSYYYNTSVALKTIAGATSGYDIGYDAPSQPPPSNYSEFYSNITSGTEYHLVVDAWNDTAVPRTFYLIYSFDSTAGAQTGTLSFYWNNITNTNYTGNFTYYADNSSYLNSVASVDMRVANSYSASITSKQKLYVKVNILGYIFPRINITYPANTTYTTSPASLNYTINASNPDKCWWSNSSGLWNSTAIACGTNWSATAVQGSNTWTVYANETTGGVNSSSVTFIFDSGAPQVTIVSPTNTTYTTSPIYFNFSLNEAGYCEYSLNTGVTNYTMTANSSNTGFNATNTSIADGSYTARAYCNDTAGNKNYTTTKAFSKDTASPAIIITAPTNNSNFNISSVTFNVSLNQQGSWCGLSISGAANKTMNLNASSTGANYTNSSIADGSYTFIASCNDTNNNYNASTTYKFYVDTIFPQINFTAPTPGNASTQSANSIYVNVTANDSASNISTFIDFGNSLVLWLRAEGNAVDSSTFNWDTTDGGVTYGSGRFGKGLTGFSVSNKITVNSSLDYASNDMTISFWMYMIDYTTPNRQNPIGKAYGGDGTFTVEPGGYINFYFGSSGANAQNYTSDGSGSDVVNGAWQHWVITRNRTARQTQWYVNGVTSGAVASYSSIYDPVHSTNALSIGDDYVSPLNGSIDDVMIFNRSLSASEIQALYANTSSKYLGVNFTSLAEGSHTFKAYVQDLGGNVNKTETRQVLINNVPQIIYVSSIGSINPAEGTTSAVTFNVTMNDVDGVDNLNDSSVKANFTKSGEALRANNSCLEISGANTSTSQNYSCTINMWYWDLNGTWSVTAYGKDNNGASALNDTSTFTYARLRALTLFPEIFTFNLTIGATNRTSNENMTINNTGNYNMSGKVLVNAINLYGPGGYYINVGNFSASVLGGVLSCNITANTLINGTNVTITSSVLERGNLSTGQANETLYYCAKTVPTNIPSGVYDTRAAGSWAIVIEIALFVYAPRVNTKQKLKKKKREKQKKLEKEPLVKALNLITKELQTEYTEEKQEAAALLINEIKKKYNLNNKEISELIETRKEIPATIFSRKLGALEVVVKYLKENLNLSYGKIARVLCRDERTIWTAYSKAKQKQPSVLAIEKTEIFLPVSIFNKKLTILESAILHLKEKGLRFNEIASLLDRDQRNIWLIYSRAMKKHKGIL